MNAVFEKLLGSIEKIANNPTAKANKLKSICDLLAGSLSGYDWVGFYLVDSEKRDELILGPFSGEPTEHIRIKFGQGICGQAAEKEDTIIIDDVGKESNYLSCNIRVKSEIVLPLFKNGKIVGELDIDSHQPARFKEPDNNFLKRVADVVSRIF